MRFVQNLTFLYNFNKNVAKLEGECMSRSSTASSVGAKAVWLHGMKPFYHSK